MRQFRGFALHLLIATLTLALAILLPVPGALGRFLKYGAYPTLFLLILVFWFCFSGTRAWRAYLGLASISAVLGMTVSWLWRGDYADWGVIGGLLPISDASIYTMDARRLLMGANLSPVSSYRTMANGFLAVLLALGNYQVVLFVLAVLAALALYALAWEVRIARGALAAGITLVVVFYFARTYVGKALTETLGLAFSALAFALLIRGARVKSRVMLLCGLGILTLAMNIRAGALVVIPALLVWAAVVLGNSGRISLRFLGAGAAVIVLGFALTAVQSRVIGSQGSIPFANFADSFYGLAAGYKGWRYIGQVHPGAAAIEKYRDTLLLIRAQPLSLLKGIGKAYLDFFNPSSYNLFSFMNLHVEEGGNLYLGAPGAAKGWMYAPVFLAGIAGVVGSLRRRHSTWHSMILFGLAGVLISVPFAPPVDAGMRPYAVTVPLVAFLLAEGVLAFLKLLKVQAGAGAGRPNDPDVRWALPLALALALILFAGPMFIKGLGSGGGIGWLPDCPAGQEPLALQPVEGARLILSDGEGQRRPAISVDGFRNNAARLLASPALVEQLVQLRAGQMVLYAVDAGNLDNATLPVFLVGDRQALEALTRPFGVCARSLSTETFGRFVVAAQIFPLPGG